MYSRPQPYRYAGDVRLPQNYSGNTFRRDEEDEDPQKEDTVEEKVEELREDLSEKASKEDENAKKDTVTASLLPKSSFKLRLGSLFGNGKKGIGTEEFLIIALILLLSDNNENDDLILLLILLFFIG